jgi:Domain of unknown function DUF488
VRPAPRGGGHEVVTQLFTASYRAYQPGWGLAVVTSLGLPKFRPEAGQWPRCWLITPTPALFHASADVFFEGYIERLDRFGPARIARVLERIARENDAESLVLLCFEREPEQCHRGLFAAWLLDRTGEVCPELM